MHMLRVTRVMCALLLLVAAGAAQQTPQKKRVAVLDFD